MARETSHAPPSYYGQSKRLKKSILIAERIRYVFLRRDRGHISTRQIQRLLDTVEQKAGLQEVKLGKNLIPEEGHATSFEASASADGHCMPVLISATCKSSWVIPH